MEGYSLLARLVITTLLAVASIAVCGCATTSQAELICWNPPEIHQTAGKTVAVSRITGAGQTAAAIQQAFMSFRPEVNDRLPRLLAQADLQRYSTIQLVAANEAEPSDMALMHAARTQRVDYLLSGEVLEGRGAIGSADALSISWRLIDVENNQVLGGRPVTVTGEVLGKTYPDLAASPDRRSALIEAVARESWRLLSPHLRPYQVELAEPKWTPGAKQVRAGNQFAKQGNWFAAEQIWWQVIQKHPRQYAAMHNLALAFAAKQDFVNAKRMAQQALRHHDNDLHRRTTVWIELRQMDYVKAFGLSPPAEGWLFSPEDNDSSQAMSYDNEKRNANYVEFAEFNQ